jgi:hypothetical protein
MTKLTPEIVAEHLTGSDNDYAENLDGWPSLYAEGNVLHIKVTPGDDKDNPVYFHAVIKPGEYDAEGGA